MAEVFLALSRADRAEALGVAATASGRPAHILEKDVWVVWTLDQLFNSPFGQHLVFKGGTSLSKAYNAISRFSEDIDVTYDIREIAADLVQSKDDNPIPPNPSQAGKWTKKIRKRLPPWITSTVLPHIETQLRAERLNAKANAENENVFIEYERAVEGYGYIAPRIRIEFGARSTGEPAVTQEIACDAAQLLPNLTFPTAKARVMAVERTFWEKLTAIHVFSLQGNIRDRLARHWYDVAQLDKTGHAEHALKNRDIAHKVAEHKRWFFAEDDANKNPIDYVAAVETGLTLVPAGPVLDALRADYQKMIEDGLFLGDAPTFDEVIEHCRSLQTRIRPKAH